MPRPTRREFVRRSLLASAVSLTADSWLSALELADLQTACAPDATTGGTPAGGVPLGGLGAVAQPLDVKTGSGLDARLFTDLSTLTPGTLITPTERFYIRTECPDRLPDATAWSIRIDGQVQRPRTIALREMERLTTDIGPCLMECAGNNNPSDFGLMSAARWSGIPVDRVFEMASIDNGVTSVLIEGFDEHSDASRNSVPGASWIFGVDELVRAGAILAAGMNGAPLPRDHGFPVRLFVPGWYGCASIKWVTRIAFVKDETPATTQMKEFAARTHQERAHDLARDYVPAIIDAAATPIRIEKWQTPSGLRYRVIGIVWGGAAPVDALEIRFNRDEPYSRITVCPPRTSSRTWSLWSYVWQPKTPGRYHINLRVPDEGVRTRRLDLRFYSRAVWIEEI